MPTEAGAWRTTWQANSSAPCWSGGQRLLDSNQCWQCCSLACLGKQAGKLLDTCVGVTGTSAAAEQPAAMRGLDLSAAANPACLPPPVPVASKLLMGTAFKCTSQTICLWASAVSPAVGLVCSC